MQARYAARVGYPHKIYLHAEIHAIVKARAPIHWIEVKRYSKTGKPMFAKPCPICMLAIKEAGIKEVSYTTEE